MRKLVNVALLLIVTMTLYVPVIYGAEVAYEGDPLAVKEPVRVNGILFVNKKNPLPSTYAPQVVNIQGHTGEQVAVDALQMLIDGAKRDYGYNIKVVSGYRDYAYQTTLYNNYVTANGKAEADKFSARPGYSEHQTGLTFDVLGGTTTKLTEAFGTTAEGKWIAENAYKYGYIVRYPKGKDGVTGYQYEPWHLRYIGVSEAQKMKDSGKETLEEYFNLVDKAAKDEGDKEGDGTGTGTGEGTGESGSGAGTGNDTGTGGTGNGAGAKEKFNPFRDNKIGSSVVGVDSAESTIPSELSYTMTNKAENTYKLMQKVMVVMSAGLLLYIGMQIASLAVAQHSNRGQGETARKVESALFGTSGYGSNNREQIKIVATNVILLMVILTLVLGSYYVTIQAKIYAGIAYVLSFIV